MFERRLKIFLALLVIITGILLMRAAQVQVLQHDKFKQDELKLQKQVQLTPTVRGKILDFTGTKELAIDVPCTDACVDYRAIIDPPDSKWVRDIASQRLKNRLGPEYRIGPDDHKASRAELQSLRLSEIANVKKDIDSMWQTLAEDYPPTDETEIGTAAQDPRPIIEEMRQQIVRDVQMRRRLIWYRNFQQSKTKTQDAPRWEKWLAGDSTDGPDISMSLPVAEESEPHVILRAIPADILNQLGKKLEKFPGLVLRPSTHRSYPLKNIACHILGRMSRVSAEDIKQALAEHLPEDRMYHPNDMIGREGIENLCEPLLRGSRGKIEKRIGEDASEQHTDFIPGQDVTITIDADLQAQIQDMLKHVRAKELNGKFITPEPGMNMHAAAVVIDIKTGEVRAMASNPDFDVNDLDTRYTELAQDHLDNPLLDRATCDQFEPGSSVKPMVGLAAITEGAIGARQGIECTGFLILNVNGRPQRQRTGRCWVASEYSLDYLKEHNIFSYAHHPIPTPHIGKYGNPNGWLSYCDALERSCNVYFETVADKLGPAALAKWYDRFGFGRITGIGITERKGLRPGQRPLGPYPRMENCSAGIGQGQVWATPLQIANEAATIARGGIWMRPRLLTADTQSRLDGARPPQPDQPPDVVDLHLDPEGLRQAIIGMTAVVNGVAGTGTTAHRSDMTVAGKTGTATAAKLWQVLHDVNGKTIREPILPAYEGHPPTSTEWYRSTDDKGEHVDHAWFMGFAPAENPQIAFCVLVEYGGSGGGGGVSGPIVSNILEACEKHGYLHPVSPLPSAASIQ